MRYLILVLLVACTNQSEPTEFIIEDREGNERIATLDCLYDRNDEVISCDEFKGDRE